ncbi:MAG: hypothetical protein HQ518_21700 [Rhodopirellula sp.]|nr:hypothetical protein [Rhodopirellula sp.]
MRPRQDFYTLCPSCETRVELTLAAKLQSARAGCMCHCQSCKHEWVCIQEWIYRRESIDHSQPIATPHQYPAAAPAVQPQATGFPQASPATIAAVQPPRPHLPTFQPPQPIAPMVHQQPVAQTSEVPVSIDQPTSKPVPAPHAWSWERKTVSQPSPSQDFQSGYGH